MIVDGKAIAEDIKKTLTEEVLERKDTPRLFIITVGDDAVSERYLRMKKKFGEAIGVEVSVVSLENEADIIEYIKHVPEKNAGVIVQLPLPSSFNTEKILEMIPSSKDPDMLSGVSLHAYEEGTTKIVPPVVGAVKEILLRHGVFVGNKHVAIMGRGKLVGAPSAVWFRRHGSIVSVVSTKTKDASEILKQADIIVTGVGKAGVVQPSMIKEGVVIIDAGTSELGGETRGDVDRGCSEKATIFTPVPGGVGPITVAMLFKNLLELTREEN